MNKKRLKTPMLKLLCSYSGRLCTRDRISGYSYCITHIFEDKSAPFQRCEFVLEGKRCRNATPKNRKGMCYCPYHIRRFNVMQQQSAAKKIAPENTVPQTQSQNDHQPTHNLPETKVNFSTTDLKDNELVFNNNGNKVGDAWLETSDESDSDLENSYDDPLKHASVYTYEEVASIYRQKLMRLQSLYIHECKYLSHILREKRRKFLHTKAIEKKQNISTNLKEMDRDTEMQYKTLKSLFRFRHHYGKDAVLFHKYLEKRKMRDENAPLNQNISQCAFLENKLQCTKKAVVLSKYCFDHILSDPQQVLFQRCEDANCPKPVFPINNTACILHARCHISPDKRKIVKNGPSSAIVTNDKIMDPLQSIDDVASLELNAVSPQSLFNLNQFGDIDGKFEESIIDSLVSGCFDSEDL